MTMQLAGKNDNENDEIQGKTVSNRVSNKVYYINTIGLYTLELIGAIYIDDLTIIFGFVAAIAESMLTFIVPALFYLLSCKVANNRPNPLLKMLSVLYVVLGLTLFVFASYHNLRKFV